MPLTDCQRRAQEPAAPLGWPRHETEDRRRERIRREIESDLANGLSGLISRQQAAWVVTALMTGDVSRISIDWSDE